MSLLGPAPQEMVAERVELPGSTGNKQKFAVVVRNVLSLAYEQANKLGHLQVAAGSLPPLTELVDSRIGASSNSAGGK
jgi:hypothetical protein